MITAQEARDKTFKDFLEADQKYLEDRIYSAISMDKCAGGVVMYADDKQIKNFNELLKAAMEAGYSVFRSPRNKETYYIIWNENMYNADKFGQLERIWSTDL